MNDNEKSNANRAMGAKSDPASVPPTDGTSRSKGDAASVPKAAEQPPPVPMEARSPPPLPEGAWAMRASELDSAGHARAAADDRPYYGASDARGRGVGARAKDAAFESIRYAKDQAFDSISEGVGDLGKRTTRAAHGFTDFVGTHAVPLTLLGAGLGLLLANLSSARRAAAQPDQTGPSRDAGSPGAERHGTAGLAARASEALHEGRDLVVERAHDVKTQVTDRAKELGQQMKHMGDEAASYGRKAYGALGRAGTRTLKLGGDNPFVTGLLALVLGATAGLLLPTTRRENRLMGERRDHLLDTVQRSAKELKETAQHGVEELKSAVSPQLQSST